MANVSLFSLMHVNDNWYWFYVFYLITNQYICLYLIVYVANVSLIKVSCWWWLPLTRVHVSMGRRGEGRWKGSMEEFEARKRGMLTTGEWSHCCFRHYWNLEQLTNEGIIQVFERNPFQSKDNKIANDFEIQTKLCTCKQGDAASDSSCSDCIPLVFRKFRSFVLFYF